MNPSQRRREYIEAETEKQRRRVADEARDEEKAMRRKTAVAVGMTPSDQFVPPVMNIDGPPDYAEGVMKVEAGDTFMVKVGTGKPTVPRVARSIDDLKVGQVVACYSDIWLIQVVTQDNGSALLKRWNQVVILSDPPSESVAVPKELIDRLAEAEADFNKPLGLTGIRDLLDAARAVVREVRGEDTP